MRCSKQFINKLYNIMISLSLLFFLTANSYAFSLVGTWKLISIENQNNNYKMRCYSPTGLLTYTVDGYMAAGINCMKSESNLNPNFNSENITFYMGRYLIKGNKVLHVVQNSSDPAYYGKKLEREIIVLNNNEIILLVNARGGNFVQLKWRRMIACYQKNIRNKNG